MTVASGLGMGLSISARYITYLCTFWANAYALTLGGDKKNLWLGNSEEDVVRNNDSSKASHAVSGFGQ